MKKRKDPLQQPSFSKEVLTALKNMKRSATKYPDDTEGLIEQINSLYQAIHALHKLNLTDNKTK